MAKTEYTEIILAVKYWHAVRILMNNITTETMHLVEPVCHLLCTSSELALKHYLIVKGVPRKEVGTRDIGHDLIKLFKKAGELGLSIRLPELNALCGMHVSHKSHVFRYGFEGQSIDFTLPPAMLKSTAALIDVCSGNPMILRGAYGPEGTTFEWPIDWDHPILAARKPQTA